MSQITNTNPEAAAKTFTAEEIAAAQAILAAVSQSTLSPDITSNNVSTGTSVSPITTADNHDAVTADLTDNTYMPAVGTSDVSGSDLHTTSIVRDGEVTFVIDPAKRRELEEKFQEMISNPRYWENPNRIKRLKEALVLPVFDNRSMQQFFISAKEELLAKEMKAAIAENRIPVMPTEDAIKALAEKKYDDKRELDAEKAISAAAKAAKKKA